MKCQFILISPQEYSVLFKQCFQCSWNILTTPSINHFIHKTCSVQIFILQYEIVPNNYYFHGFQNTLFHQILSEDFVGLLGFQYTKVYSPKGICLTPLLRLLCRFCTIVCLPRCRLGLYPSRFIYWPTYALPRHQGISWS